MKDVKCPYCRKWQEIDHDDGYGYEEEVLHQQECGDCGKIFGYSTSISFYYEAIQLPCANDEPHAWGLDTILPEWWSRMKCEICGIDRDPTDEEREMLKIPEYARSQK